MKKSKIILGILILSVIVLVFSGCGGGNPVVPPIDNGDGAVAIEVPLSPYYSNSNTDWWQYQYDGYENDPDHAFNKNVNCGPACSAMLINYLRDKGVTTTYHTSISSAYPEVHCYARGDYCKANGHPNGYNNSDWVSPGATTEQIRSALSSENIQTHPFTGYDCFNEGSGITNLQNAIDQGKVCICLVVPMYYRDEISEPFNHWVIAYGYDNNYIYLNDPGYHTGQGFPASKSDFADSLWYVIGLSTVIVSDTTIYNYPTVDSFSVTPTSVTLGNSFNISYTVSDDNGLQQTELWRVNDVGGEPGDWDTLDNPIFTKVLSGEKNYSGSFTDTPDTAGTYWYGMHVVDTSGNWSVEPKPPGPIVVTVTSVTPETYTITASAGPNGSISPSGNVTVNQGSDKSFTITPDTGYSIDDVLVDESSVGAVSSYTFTNVTQDHAISATFNTDGQAEILEVLDKFDNAILSRNWEEAKSYCVVGSEAYEAVDVCKDLIAQLELLCDDITMDYSDKEILNVKIEGKFAEVSRSYSYTFALIPLEYEEEVSAAIECEEIIYFEKIENSWKLNGGDLLSYLAEIYFVG